MTTTQNDVLAQSDDEATLTEATSAEATPTEATLTEALASAEEESLRLHKGGKPFDIDQPGYRELLQQIGQPEPVAAPVHEH